MAPSRLDFADFYRDSWAPCLRAVSACSGNLALAEDQLAEAFARAWASWRHVSVHPAPRAWVVRTALNVGTSWWRRRRREVSLADQDRAGGPELPASLEGPLLGAVRRLPQREREVVVLRLVLDLSTQATARELGIAAGTVRAHLSRAVAALRLEIVPDDFTEAEPCTMATK